MRKFAASLCVRWEKWQHILWTVCTMLLLILQKIYLMSSFFQFQWSTAYTVLKKMFTPHAKIGIKLRMKIQKLPRSIICYNESCKSFKHTCNGISESECWVWTHSKVITRTKILRMPNCLCFYKKIKRCILSTQQYDW